MTSGKPYLCIFLLVTWLAPLKQLSSQIENIRIPFQSLNTSHGLASNQVNCIIRDSMGFYWYGTSLGLNRHDGNHLELFEHEEGNYTSLPEDHITHLLAANTFIVAGLTVSGKLFIYDYRTPGYNQITRIPLASTNHTSFKAETLSSDGVSLYVLNADGDIISISLSDLSSHVFFTDAEHTLKDPNLAICLNGYLWVGTENGLFSVQTSMCSITKSDLSFYTTHPHGNVSVWTIEPYDDHSFLLSSARSRSYPFKGIIKYNHILHTDTLLCLKAMDKHLDEYPIDIVKKIKGSLIFIRVHTLSRFLYDIETHEWDTLPVVNHHSRHLNSSSLNCVASELNGRYRIGSNQGIFIHLPEFAMFEEYYPHKGIYYARQWTGLYRDEVKNLYVGNPSAINVFHTPTKALTSTTRFLCVQDHHRSNQQPSLIELDSTRLLVLASYLYLYDIRSNSFTLIENDSVSHLPVHIQSNLFPYVVRDSTCYFARDGRLYQIHLNSLRLSPLLVYDSHQQETYLDASGLAFDSTGYLWITTYNKGLVRYWPGDGHFFSYQLYHNTCLLNDIIIDADNVAWIASAGCGLIKAQIDSLLVLHLDHFSKKEGYVSSVLNQLMEDEEDRIWTTSGYGINYFDKKTGSVYNFSKEHGLAFPHNFYRGKTRDHEGNFYVSGSINIVKIDPKKFKRATTPPALFIKQFQINNNAVGSFWKDTSITLIAGQNHFSFQLSAINHIHAQLNKYKYILENYHSDWISTDHSQLVIPFSNLKGGRYTFRAKASNHEGVWNTKGINIHLRILPPFYKTWWFSLGIIMSGFVLIYYFFRLRTERLLAIQRIDIEKKLALEAERSRISRDMHDDLGSGLSAIHLLSNFVKENAQKKYPEFSQEVEKIQQSSEELNHAIREIIWTVNSKDDTLQSLILFVQRFAHEMHEKSRIPVIVHVPDLIPDIPLDGSIRKQVYLSVKEAVNNALKHGSPKEINIRIQADAEKLVSIRVIDNGKGFLNTLSDKTYTGNGLSNMRERMADIGGKVEIHSSASGTDVHFTIQA